MCCLHLIELESDLGTNYEVIKLPDLYHPQSDGFIRQIFLTFGWCLQALCHEKDMDCDMSVPFVIMNYRRMLVWLLNTKADSEKGGKLRLSWMGPILMVKMLDSGPALIRRKRLKSLTKVHLDHLNSGEGNMIPAYAVAAR